MTHPNGTQLACGVQFVYVRCSLCLDASTFATALQEYSFPLGDKKDVKKKLTDLVTQVIQEAEQADAAAVDDGGEEDNEEEEQDDAEVGLGGWRPDETRRDEMRRDETRRDEMDRDEMR